MKIEPYSEAHVGAVRAFNRRMVDGGVPERLEESPVPAWLPARPGMPLYQQPFVVVDDDSVRGGYYLKHQPFWLDGETVQAADYRAPVSERVLDSRFGLVGLLMVKDAVRRQPLCFGLGMGSRSATIARLLGIVRWKMVDCPFFFFVNRPFRFLRGIAHLRRRPALRMVFDLLAFTGLGWGIVRTTTLVQGVAARRSAGTEAQGIAAFGPECDEVWERARRACRFVAVRDLAMLERLYPGTDERFCRILVRRDGRAVGWAVMLDTAMREHKQFGNLRVGSIVDCLAVPGNETAVVAQATRFLRGRGVDLIISNQLHRDWCRAFGACGYRSGPSNFIFAAAPELARRLEPFDEASRLIHMTRGDGDGPINL